ncbi:MAG TPA: hypothetical protein VFL90_06505 [Methylomirabilota bacterium]|nr:hypothetical protein [Methylomirabilota bacterium]
MKQFLRGNYTLDVVIEEPQAAAEDATEAFERKALSRLGGSICFVSKKGFLWKGDGADGSGTADRQPA